MRICLWLHQPGLWVWMEASSVVSHHSRELPPPTTGEGCQAATERPASQDGWEKRVPLMTRLPRGGAVSFGCGASRIHLAPHCSHLCPWRSPHLHLDLGQREGKFADGCPCMVVACYPSSSLLLPSEASP